MIIAIVLLILLCKLISWFLSAVLLAVACIYIFKRIQDIERENRSEERL